MRTHLTHGAKAYFPVARSGCPPWSFLVCVPRRDLSVRRLGEIWTHGRGLRYGVSEQVPGLENSGIKTVGCATLTETSCPQLMRNNCSCAELEAQRMNYLGPEGLSLCGNISPESPACHSGWFLSDKCKALCLLLFRSRSCLRRIGYLF